MPTADGVPECESLVRLGQLAGFTVTDCGAPPPTTVVIKLSNVQYGRTNGDVQTVQAKLTNLGFNPGPQDGFYGDQTRSAYASWETSIGMATVDGIAGCESLTPLGNANAAPVFTTSCDIANPAPPTNTPPPTNDGEPVHNYTRLTYTSATGAVINQRTKDMLDRAVVQLSDSYSWTPYLSQGSYNPGGVSGSAGTHDGGGVVDIRTSTMTINGADLCVQALRQVGFAAWRRTDAEGFSPHIHAVAIGDREMSASAQDQVQDYFNGRNGLANNGPDTLSSTYRTPVPMWPAWCNKYNF